MERDEILINILKDSGKELVDKWAEEKLDILMKQESLDYCEKSLKEKVLKIQSIIDFMNNYKDSEIKELFENKIKNLDEYKESSKRLKDMFTNIEIKT